MSKTPRAIRVSEGGKVVFKCRCCPGSELRFGSSSEAVKHAYPFRCCPACRGQVNVQDVFVGGSARLDPGHIRKHIERCAPNKASRRLPPLPPPPADDAASTVSLSQAISRIFDASTSFDTSVVLEEQTIMLLGSIGAITIVPDMYGRLVPLWSMTAAALRVDARLRDRNPIRLPREAFAATQAIGTSEEAPYSLSEADLQALGAACTPDVLAAIPQLHAALASRPEAARPATALPAADTIDRPSGIVVTRSVYWQLATRMVALLADQIWTNSPTTLAHERRTGRVENDIKATNDMHVVRSPDLPCMNHRYGDEDEIRDNLLLCDVKHLTRSDRRSRRMCIGQANAYALLRTLWRLHEVFEPSPSQPGALQTPAPLYEILLKDKRGFAELVNFVTQEERDAIDRSPPCGGVGTHTVGEDCSLPGSEPNNKHLLSLRVFAGHDQRLWESIRQLASGGDVPAAGGAVGGAAASGAGGLLGPVEGTLAAAGAGSQAATGAGFDAAVTALAGLGYSASNEEAAEAAVPRGGGGVLDEESLASFGAPSSAHDGSVGDLLSIGSVSGPPPQRVHVPLGEDGFSTLQPVDDEWLLLDVAGGPMGGMGDVFAEPTTRRLGRMISGESAGSAATAPDDQVFYAGAEARGPFPALSGSDLAGGVLLDEHSAAVMLSQLQERSDDSLVPQAAPKGLWQVQERSDQSLQPAAPTPRETSQPSLLPRAVVNGPVRLDPGPERSRGSGSDAASTTSSVGCRRSREEMSSAGSEGEDEELGAAVIGLAEAPAAKSRR